jgi:hypothetical protein
MKPFRQNRQITTITEKSPADSSALGKVVYGAPLHDELTIRR